jgi:hypothetical protein
VSVRLARQPARVPERPAEQILDLAVQAPEILGRPGFQGRHRRGLEPQEEWSTLALTGHG